MEQEKTAAEKVGDNLKKLFKEHNCTYDDVAEILSCDPRTVGRWVQNGLNSINDIVRIAELFDVKLEDILSFDKD